VSLSFLQQRREADFRFGLMHLREHHESVAFHNGEAGEKRRLSELFDLLAHNWRQIMGLTKRVTFFSTSMAQATLVFPLMVGAPAYFSGAIPLGGVFQTANALNRVVENMSWFVTYYIELAAYSATIQRLWSFRDAVDRAHLQPQGPSLHFLHGAGYRTEGVNIDLPDGRRLLSDVNFSLSPGQSVMISGPSGQGKSTLLRTLAGIWPYASGALTKPVDARTLFAPQKAYVPPGPLRWAIEYPGLDGAADSEALVSALQTVGLDSLTASLDVEDAWARRLSGGEAQRLVWARIILHRPDVLFLDEATANLDAEWEEAFYTHLKRELPGLTLVSVAHRPNLRKFHDTFIRVDRDRGVIIVPAEERV
jgi:putative ATP-binding cassette transporter